MSKIKICGLMKPEDVDAVNEALPDYTGFIFAPSRRQISTHTAAQFRERLNPTICAVGVFVDAPEDEVIKICQQNLIDCVQLHGQESPDYINRLHSYTDKPLIKAFRCQQQLSEETLAIYSAADYFLFDSGAGSGQTFDWSRIPSSPKPFFLAGGLHPDLIEDAVKAVHPYALDLSSGVETNGQKDRKKILETVRRIRNVKR